MTSCTVSPCLSSNFWPMRTTSRPQPSSLWNSTSGSWPSATRESEMVARKPRSRCCCANADVAPPSSSALQSDATAALLTLTEFMYVLQERRDPAPLRTLRTPHPSPAPAPAHIPTAAAGAVARSSSSASPRPMPVPSPGQRGWGRWRSPASPGSRSPTGRSATSPRCRRQRAARARLTRSATRVASPPTAAARSRGPQVCCGHDPRQQRPRRARRGQPLQCPIDVV